MITPCWRLIAATLTCIGTALAACACQHAAPFKRGSAPIELAIPSTYDETERRARFIPSPHGGPQPLFVFLHSWSADYTQDNGAWKAEAARRGWHYLQPDFRGPNVRPEACASPAARQDILDAVDYVAAQYPVDPQRIYLAGVSGGGHMALVMAAEAPARWSAVSAWAGITDLAAWHAECRAAGRKYANDIEAVAGGAPGDSAATDAALRYRSPVHHLAAAKGRPIQIATGIDDGHTGSVPIHHSIDAFNVLAVANSGVPVDAETIARLSAREVDVAAAPLDPVYGRRIVLRQQAGPAELVIFEGGHEGLPEPACAWLAQHKALGFDMPDPME